MKICKSLFYCIIYRR